jgi:hypothetical protein
LEAGTITTRELAVEIQTTINRAMTEETTQALITANLNQFESNLSKTFITEEEATKQIQTATEIAVEQTTQSVVNNSVQKAMENVNDQLDNKLSDFSTNTMNPALQQAMDKTLQDSKNYVVEVTGNYYTKSETDSKISQTRESIELGTSETSETKENTSVKISEAIDGVTVGAINRVFGTGKEKEYTFTGIGNEIFSPYDISSDISDKEVIVSFEYDINATVQNGSKLIFQPYYMSVTNQATYSPTYEIINSKTVQSINLKNQQVSFTTTFHSVQQDCKFRFRADGITGTFKVRKAQIKVGNKITEWSVAPEDLETNANNYTIEQLKSYYTKTQTDSLIKATKDEINLGVSSTYETKTNVTTKVNNAITTASNDATTKMNNAINDSTTKVNNALTEAKNDATTKANNAKNDAINHTNSVIVNYYTKEQTNSQINLTKESIESTVSKTYATKLDIENMSIGGENLLPNSNFANGLLKWYIHEPLPTNNPNATNKSVGILNNGNGNASWADPTINTLQIIATTLPDRYGVQSNNIRLQANTEYVISGYFAGHRVGTVQINIRDIDNNSSNVSTKNYNPVSGGNSLSKYYYFEHVFKTTANTNFAVNLYGTNFGSDGHVWFANIKLEKGNKATSWSPCEEDYKLYADQTTNQISSELGDLSKIVSDNTGSDSITSAMKKKLISEYNDAIAVYNKLYSMYSVLGDTSFNNLPTELTTAKNDLTSVISPLESSINEASESGLSEILNRFNIFYSLTEELTQAISNALTGMTKEVKTQVTQLADNYTISASRIENIGNQVNELSTHFVFSTDGLTIKSTANATKTVHLDNDSLDFMDNGTVVAQITDKQLLITDAEVKNQMKIGNILIKPSGIGGIMFIYE